MVEGASLKALGMALALIVEKSTPTKISADTSRLFFYVGGIAALTLVINATTAKSLLFALGLLGSDSAEKRLVTAQVSLDPNLSHTHFLSIILELSAVDEEEIEEAYGEGHRPNDKRV